MPKRRLEANTVSTKVLCVRSDDEQNRVSIKPHANMSMNYTLRMPEAPPDENESGYLRMDSTGQLYVDVGLQAPSLTIDSDVRLKTDISPLGKQLYKILRMKAITYVHKEDRHKEKQMGFVAQELKKIQPESVTVNSQRGIYQVRYAQMVASLVVSIQELERRVAHLENSKNK